MTNITVDNIMNLNPCPLYTRELVTELWNDKESLSLKEILDLDIPINDRSWVLARLVPTEITIKWARYCADKAKEYAGCADKAEEAAHWVDRTAHWATDYITSAVEAAYRGADYASNYASNAAYYAAETAHWASNVHMNYKKTLYNLLEKLVEMSEEKQ